MVTGSGAQNRDEEIMGHKPFLVIADYLTRNGIAVLRCDDRGTAASQGNHATATNEDFARDTEAAIHYLRGRKEINTKRLESSDIAQEEPSHSLWQPMIRQWHLSFHWREPPSKETA